MSPDKTEQLHTAMAHIQRGDKAEARRILQPLLKQYPQDADVWYAAALVTDGYEQQIRLLERVIELDPLHAPAAQRLDQLRDQRLLDAILPEPEAASAYRPVDLAVESAPTPATPNTENPWREPVIAGGLILLTIALIQAISTLAVLRHVDSLFSGQATTVVALIQRGAQTQIAAYPTPLPPPTSTRLPTQIPAATWTPGPSSTPYPTRTLVPTSTRYIPPTLTATPSITPTISTFINLEGAVTKVVYDAQNEMAYGIDAVNQRIVFIDLAQKQTSGSMDLPYTPSDLCVDHRRNQMFVVNFGNPSISAFDLGTKHLVRNIPWPAPTWAGMQPRDELHFHIVCQEDRLFVIDATWSPAPWIIPLDGDPKPFEFYPHTEGNEEAVGRSIGDLVFTTNKDEYYYWFQFGWSAGIVSSNMFRVRIDGTKLMQADSTDFKNFDAARDPRDTPIFYDANSRRLITKVFVFNSENLKQIYHKFKYDSYNPSQTENIYAVDWAHNFAASKRNLYELNTFRLIQPLPFPNGDALFFDKSGRLYILDSERGLLYYLNLWHDG